MVEVFGGGESGQVEELMVDRLTGRDGSQDVIVDGEVNLHMEGVYLGYMGEIGNQEEVFLVQGSQDREGIEDQGDFVYKMEEKELNDFPVFLAMEDNPNTYKLTFPQVTEDVAVGGDGGLTG